MVMMAETLFQLLTERREWEDKVRWEDGATGERVRGTKRGQRNREKEGNREWEGQGERKFHMVGYRKKAMRERESFADRKFRM